MANSKDVLVVTTSTVEGLKVKRYLKPVSAHVVAGTNLFNDFLGGISDVFGGRSHTYQKQLASLYNEAIQRVKDAAYEIGANGIIGLNIDMDEISGKGKSMFMLTAVGTAVILIKEINEEGIIPKYDEKPENVSVDQINLLRSKKEIIEKATNGSLKFNNDIWDFVTTNQVYEFFPHLLTIYQEVMANERVYPGSVKRFHDQLVNYIDAFPEEKKLNLLYGGVAEENDQIALKLSEIIKELNLFDYERNMKILKSPNFSIQKRGLRLITYDKPFYNKQDIQHLKNIQEYIQENFTERGERTTKKQMFSSRGKGLWTCECGKTNDIDTRCSVCGQDIYGFKAGELNHISVNNYISQKIDLITEYLR